MAALCRDAVTGKQTDNLHFFVNSVEFIAKSIKTAGLTSEQVKVVCSTSGESHAKNSAKLGTGYSIAQPADPVKKINFYTSTCFEGCDIMDANGRTYIVSDGKKAHTLIDISTLFVQICGRIRNSVYKTEVTHIYSMTKYSQDVTWEEFRDATKRTLESAEYLADNFNRMDEQARQILSSNLYLNEKYVRIEDNNLIVDRNLAHIDIVNFKVCRHIYRTYVNLVEEQQRCGLHISVQTYTKMPPSEKLQINPQSKVSFQELFDEYCTLREHDTPYVLDNGQKQIEQHNPLVREAYEKLGKDKVIAMKYHVSNIRRELVRILDAPMIYKVVGLANQVFPFQQAIPACKAKERLQHIYDQLGILRTAKATDLAEWYEIKNTAQRIDGKSVACIVVVRDKFVRVKRG